MALSDDILKLQALAKGGNPLQAGMDQAGGTSQLPQAPAAQPPQVALQQPLMTPELAAQREAARGGAGDPNMESSGLLGQIAQVPAQIGRDVNNFLGTAQRALTPQSELGYTPPTLGDVAASAGIRDAQGNVFGGGSTPSIAPASASIPTPQELPSTPSSPMRTGAEGSPQQNYANFIAGGGEMTPEKLAQANEFASSMGTTFDPIAGYSRQPFEQSQAAQAGSGPMSIADTQAELQRRFGAPTVSGNMNPPTAGLETDPQGRMIPGGFATRAEAYPSYEREAAAREARQGARPDFGSAVSDADRRATGGEGMSMEQATRLTGGDQDAARAMLERQELGLDEFKTGLTPSEQTARDRLEFDIGKFKFEEAKEMEGERVAEQKSAEAAKFAVRDTIRQNQNVMTKAQRAGKNIGFKTTGATGALLGVVPGTGAYDQKATLETLQADAAFTTLQQMRDASKTGGALGQVSERELALLIAAAGNLGIGQSKEQFRENLTDFIGKRNEAMLNIYDAFASDYSPEAANDAFQVRGRSDLEAESEGAINQQGRSVTTSTGRYTATAVTD